VLLLIDNYDSFVFNLARYLEELGEDVTVVRNDVISIRQLGRLAPTGIVISPGPGTPGDAGVSLDVVRVLGPQIPILGVCLGHQCIAEAYGGRVMRARRPMHGRICRVKHGDAGLFSGLANPLAVTRYHSLVVDPAEPGAGLEVSAWTADTTASEPEVMAVQHVRHPVWGVQFHPEALQTEGGHRLLANFLALARGQEPSDAVFVPTKELSELTAPPTASNPRHDLD
jgi:anthranilate synthase/aminodeoxychorismate synthase-like glutamine amidotransferase